MWMSFYLSIKDAVTLRPTVWELNAATNRSCYPVIWLLICPIYVLMHSPNRVQRKHLTATTMLNLLLIAAFYLTFFLLTYPLASTKPTTTDYRWVYDVSYFQQLVYCLAQLITLG